MANPGVYPLNPLTPVGQFRLASGDTQSVPLVPPVAGEQDYTSWSDAEITQYLLSGGGSVNRGIGYAWLQAAGAAAMQSKSVKDYDLAVDLTKRSEDLRRTAQFYFDLADQEDVIAGSEDAFEIVDTGDDRQLWNRVEGFPYWPGLAS